MALTDENGSGMVMPVAPMYGNGNYAETEGNIDAPKKASFLCIFTVDTSRCIPYNEGT